MALCAFSKKRRRLAAQATADRPDRPTGLLLAARRWHWFAAGQIARVLLARLLVKLSAELEKLPHEPAARTRT